jgi:hypothetical protein
MRRLPGHLITTVPLVASQIFFRADMSAMAGEFTPLATVELLSKSHAADTRCKFLDPASHDELGRYVVHVERAAAEIEGRAAARTAFAQGLQAGKSAECSTQIEAETVSTLKAARRAMAAMRGDRAIAESAAIATEERNSPQSILPAAGELAVHEQRMAAYFTELHCDHLAYRQKWKFWRVIVAQHQAAVGQFGPEAASDAKERAQTLSESRKCSKETAALVQAQYREIVRK